MIRAADIADAAAITVLWNEVIRDTTVTFTTELKLEADVRAMIGDPTRSVLVVEHDGMFAGFALFGSFRSGPGYARTVEHSIYVRPEFHGIGLGAALMRALEQAAVAQGHHVMVAGISGTNQAAVKFHENVGFMQVAHMPEVGQKNGVWHDMILMQKIM